MALRPEEAGRQPEQLRLTPRSLPEPNDSKQQG
jgi:hypothetical protein